MEKAQRAPDGDTEAELAVLALGLSDPTLWPSILARLQPEDFQSPWCSRLVGYAAAQAEAGTLVGLAELAGQVPSTDRQQLADLRSHATAPTRLDYWSERVREAAGRIRLRRLAWTLGAAAQSPQRSLSDIAAEASRTLSDIVSPGIAAKVLTAPEWLARWWEDVNRRASAESASDLGVPTGVATLDRDVLVERGHMVLVAAATGVGKTAFGLSVARSAASSGRSVLYANTEMDPEALASRIIAAEAGVSVSDLRRGRSDADGWKAVSKARGVIERGWCLCITLPLAGTEPEAIAHLARAHRATHGLDVLVLDYVGRLDITPAYGEREWNVLERIAARMKALAVELACAVYLLVQRTDDGTIAGSRRMRNDADLVLEITAVEDEDKKVREKWPAASHLITITKARHAKGGYPVPVVFDRERMTWTEVGRGG